MIILFVFLIIICSILNKVLEKNKNKVPWNDFEKEKQKYFLCKALLFYGF